MSVFRRIGAALKIPRREGKIENVDPAREKRSAQAPGVGKRPMFAIRPGVVTREREPEADQGARRGDVDHARSIAPAPPTRKANPTPQPPKPGTARARQEARRVRVRAILARTAASRAEIDAMAASAEVDDEEAAA